MDTPASISVIPGKFGDVVLERDGEDGLDRSCEKLISIPYSQKREKHPAYILDYT